MRRYFNRQLKLREKLNHLSARVVRNSSKAIAAIHRGDRKSFQRFLSLANGHLETLEKLVEGEPELSSSGRVFSARQELAEAVIFAKIVDGRPLASPKQVGVPYTPYLAALADVAGELRRAVLDAIRKNEVKRAEEMLEKMEEISEILMEFDYVDSVIPGIKRRQDIVRQLVERTRGDLTLALRQERLERMLREKP